jgi:hypothetical protein
MKEHDKLFLLQLEYNTVLHDFLYLFLLNIEQNMIKH